MNTRIYGDDVDHMVSFANNVDDLARLLGVTRQTLLKWVSRHRYPLPPRLTVELHPGRARRVEAVAS